MSYGSNQREGDVIVVAQSGPLSGEVVVPGAKNSVLKLMAATLLADGRYTLTRPDSTCPFTTQVQLLP